MKASSSIYFCFLDSLLQVCHFCVGPSVVDSLSLNERLLHFFSQSFENPASLWKSSFSTRLLEEDSCLNAHVYCLEPLVCFTRRRRRRRRICLSLCCLTIWAARSRRFLSLSTHTQLLFNPPPSGITTPRELSNSKLCQNEGFSFITHKRGKR